MFLQARSLRPRLWVCPKDAFGAHRSPGRQRCRTQSVRALPLDHPETRKPSPQSVGHAAFGRSAASCDGRCHNTGHRRRRPGIALGRYRSLSRRLDGRAPGRGIGAGVGAAVGSLRRQPYHGYDDKQWRSCVVRSCHKLSMSGIVASGVPAWAAIRVRHPVSGCVAEGDAHDDLEEANASTHSPARQTVPRARGLVYRVVGRARRRRASRR